MRQKPWGIYRPSQLSKSPNDCLVNVPLGIPARQPLHARGRNGPPGATDRSKTPPALCRGRRRRALCLALCALLSLLSLQSTAQSLRVATFTTELERKGPGLLLRDILNGKDPQVRGILAEIVAAQPDIIALQRFDWDQEARTATAFQTALAQGDWPMRFAYAPRPNTGVPTGLDVDGDGQSGRAKDAQGYGRFAGQRGLLLLSRYPFLEEDAKEYSHLLWADLPDSRSLDPPALAAVQRLSSVAHLQIPVQVGDTTLQILSFHATPPVFDGPEDRNGRRNADEIEFWTKRLTTLPKPFVLLANTNADPFDGAGIKPPMQDLLSHPDIQDPRPSSEGAAQAANPNHHGPAKYDTVDWPDPTPGNLRVSYVLPSRDLRVTNAGVNWKPSRDDYPSRHRLVWVDITLP